MLDLVTVVMHAREIAIGESYFLGMVTMLPRLEVLVDVCCRAS